MPRTLFVVGDEKQSIYSFQGADLANFRAHPRAAERAGSSRRPTSAPSGCSIARSARAGRAGGWSMPCSRYPRRAAASSSRRADSVTWHSALTCKVRSSSGLWPCRPHGRGRRRRGRCPTRHARRTNRSARVARASSARSATGSTAARRWRHRRARPAGRHHDPAQPARHPPGAAGPRPEAGGRAGRRSGPAGAPGQPAGAGPDGARPRRRCCPRTT